MDVDDDRGGKGGSGFLLLLEEAKGQWSVFCLPKSFCMLFLDKQMPDERILERAVNKLKGKNTVENEKQANAIHFFFGKSNVMEICV